jgi:hypothetical protein
MLVSAVGIGTTLAMILSPPRGNKFSDLEIISMPPAYGDLNPRESTSVQGAQENIWTQERGSDGGRRLEKAA